jgi:hypothetical protein
MKQSRSQSPYAVLFDRRKESWYVTIPHSRRFPLERTAIEELVALYNGIHRGNPLTITRTRTVEELKSDHCRLQQTIRNLYDFIDSEIDSPPATPPEQQAAKPAEHHGLHGLRSWAESLRSLWKRSS